MSNVPAAIVDSIVFPLIAFPGPRPAAVEARTDPAVRSSALAVAAKIGGGAVWALVLDRTAFRVPVAAA
jgi:hypothetical protein